jgi:hypothetical protein
VSYQAFVLLPVPQDKDELIDRAIRELTRTFTGRGHVERVGDGFHLAVDGWGVRGTFSTDPHVLDESRDIVDQFGHDRADAALLRSYGARIELSCAADPDMDHFTDYVLACESVERIEPAVAVDMAGPEFMSGKVLRG